jgi:hypothetical protein
VWQDCIKSQALATFERAKDLIEVSSKQAGILDN